MVSNVPSLNLLIILCSSHSKVRYNIFIISALSIFKFNIKIKIGKLFYIVKNKFIELLSGVIYENFVHLY